MKYLLGTMNAQEREEMGEHLLTDPDAFDRLREAENDLFDAYARDDMSAEQRAAFERTLLRQPGAAQKLRASRALHAPVSGAVRKWWWLSAAIAAGVAAFYLASVSPKPAAPPPAAVAVVTQIFRLAAITRGSERVPDLVLTSSTTEVEFVAPLPAGPPEDSYVVSIEKPAGGVLWTGTLVAAPELKWRVPAMPDGNYVVRIDSDDEPLAFYEFRVIRR